MFSNNDMWEAFEQCFVMCAVFYDFICGPFCGVTEHVFLPFVIPLFSLLSL